MDVSEARRVLGVGAGADLLALARARDRCVAELARSLASPNAAATEDQGSGSDRVNQAYTLLAGLNAPGRRPQAVVDESVPRDAWFWILVVGGALCGAALTKLGRPPDGTPDATQSLEWIGIVLVGALVGALGRWVMFSVRQRRKARRRSKLLDGRS